MDAYHDGIRRYSYGEVRCHMDVYYADIRRDIYKYGVMRMVIMTEYAKTAKWMFITRNTIHRDSWVNMVLNECLLWWIDRDSWRNTVLNECLLWGLHKDSRRNTVVNECLLWGLHRDSRRNTVVNECLLWATCIRLQKYDVTGMFIKTIYIEIAREIRCDMNVYPVT